MTVNSSAFQFFIRALNRFMFTHCFVSRDSSSHNFPPRKEILFSPKVIVRGLRSLIGCPFLRVYSLFSHWAKMSLCSHWAKMSLPLVQTVQGLKSLIGCSFLRAYSLCLESNISFINGGFRLCGVLHISVIRS